MQSFHHTSPQQYSEVRRKSSITVAASDTASRRKILSGDPTTLISPAPSSLSSRRARSLACSPCVEIYPGFEQRLRLSAETEEAILTGFVRTSECCVCKLEISCIQDARFVLCPVCRTITPLGDDVLADHLYFTPEGTEASFGIGLGFISSGCDNRKPPPAAYPASASSSSSLEDEEALELFD